MVKLLGHRQTKETATDKLHLLLPRHIPTLPVGDRLPLTDSPSKLVRRTPFRLHQSLYPNFRSNCLRASMSDSASMPLLFIPSITPRMPRPPSVSATMTSTGLAVAQ